MYEVYADKTAAATFIFVLVNALDVRNGPYPG